MLPLNINILKIKGHQGTSFLFAIIILFTLTMMGTFALMATDIEIKISGSQKDYLRDFYVSDSGWKMILPWLNNKGTPPLNVNTSLGDDIVKNFGGGGEGVTNDDFPEGTEDGRISDIPYWNRVKYQTDIFVPGSGKNYRRFYYLTTNNAGGRQEIDVTIYKIYKIGY